MDLPLNSKGSNPIQKIQIQFKRFKFNSKYSNSIQNIQIQFKRFNSKDSKVSTYFSLVALCANVVVMQMH